MSWTDFIMYLAIAYVVYYALIILIDMIKPQRKLASVDQGGEELQFTEVEETKVIDSSKRFQNESDGHIQKEEINTENVKQEAMETKNEIIKKEDLEFTKYYPANAEGGAQNLNDLLQLAQASSIEMKSRIIL